MKNEYPTSIPSEEKPEKRKFIKLSETEKEQIREKFLSKLDREIIQRGLEKLNEHFHDLADDEMPRVIIYPDTSARPLLYATKPLIDREFARRGLPAPDFQFVATGKGEDWIEFQNAFLHNNGIVERDSGEKIDLNKLAKIDVEESRRKVDRLFDSYEELRDRVKSDPENEDAKQKLEKVKSELDELEYTVQLAETTQGILNMAGRMKEIIGKIKDTEFDILVIDDLTGQRQSFAALNNALYELEQQNPDAAYPATYFTFFDRDTYFPLQGLDENIVAGTSDETDREKYRKFMGFRYREIYGPPSKHESIGVIKDETQKYAVKSDIADPQAMQELRDVMREQAEIFLSSLQDE